MKNIGLRYKGKLGCTCIFLEFGDPVMPNYLTADEIYDLYERCVDFAEETDDRYAFLPQMWRDKPEHYWKDIFEKKRGFMIPYMKDFNGDKRSAINGNIKGLFFSCGIDRKSKRPPYFSYFGNKRLFVDAGVLLNESKNLYFADFYCHYYNHYATLVVTNEGSKQDIFCRNHDLYQLDLFDNPLLFLYNHRGRNSVYVTLGVRVELFFTDKLNIPGLLSTGRGRLMNVQSRGRGRSRKNGIPKKDVCNICNL
ncbi:phytanoyl-CoA hydroxylase-interacting protein-like isoform X1 [Ostrea edulis]|uniref:phytanoyl-CoA hydroxylase-interacting protein-like isoform X1 n=2 Tax=Ostrea edulis TaxID=37623 RepID=UPI002095F137|nr:phytanoyl-CoA hydroxylase-interacting protein-like isoform X1 [Ostrea edulis]